MERCLTGRLPVIAAFLLAALATTGCSNQVALSDPSLPDPLLVKLPLKVAVRYTPEMTNYRYEEEVLGGQKWTIMLGSSNKILFNHLFDSMFTEVIEVGPDADVADSGADALIEADIDAFEFALPAQSRSDAYTVWIRYRLRVFDAEGQEIANWPIAAYGKAASDGLFGADKTLARAAVLAMRDAAAMVGLRFARETGLGDPGSRPAAPTSPTAEETLNALAAPGQPAPARAGAGAETADAPPQEADAAGTAEIAVAPAAADEPAGDEPADVAANTTDTNQGNFTDDRG